MKKERGKGGSSIMHNFINEDNHAGVLMHGARARFATLNSFRVVGPPINLHSKKKHSAQEFPSLDMNCLCISYKVHHYDRP